MKKLSPWIAATIVFASIGWTFQTSHRISTNNPTTDLTQVDYTKKPATNWKKTVSKDGRFEVSMPGKPTFRRSGSYPDGSPAFGMSITREMETFVAVGAEIPLRGAALSAFYSSSLEEKLKMLVDVQVLQSPEAFEPGELSWIAHQGHPGVEFPLTARLEDGVTYHERSRVLLVYGSAFYVKSGYVAKSEHDKRQGEKNTDRFLKSFRLLKIKSKPTTY